MCRATSPLRDQFGRKLPMRPCLTPAMESAQKAGAIVKGAQSGADTYLRGKNPMLRKSTPHFRKNCWAPWTHGLQSNQIGQCAPKRSGALLAPPSS